MLWRLSKIVNSINPPPAIINKKNKYWPTVLRFNFMLANIKPFTDVSSANLLTSSGLTKDSSKLKKSTWANPSSWTFKNGG